MNKRFLITAASGLVLATTAFAQSPSGSSSSTQPSANQPSSTAPSTSTTRPSTSTSQAPAAQPNGSAAQSTAPANSNTTQNQPPANSGTAQSQSSQPASPSTAQSAPSAQQPATNQAQTPAQNNQAQTPAQSGQSPTNNAQAPAPANRPATNNAQAPSTSSNVSASANIGAQEQTRISQSIARLNVRPLTNVNFSVAVGTTIPHSVRLQSLPSDIVQVVPQYRGYSFVVVRDEIVIVEPSTYKIVAVMPRSGGRAAAAPAPAQKKLKLSNREREVIRTHTRTSRQGSTIGSSGEARAQVRIGDRVPETMELREFPSTVYRTVPTVREYRYIDMDNRSYLVEPRERTVIEQID